jgi:chromosome segregation ATPase
MQPQEMVVDIEVKLGNSIVKYSNLDAAADIAESSSNGESIVIATSKDAMNSELNTLKQRSIEVINSVDFHKKQVEEYDKVIKQLNPEYAEKEQQRDEINSLKEQMAQMSQNMAALMQANTTLIEKLSKKEN